MLNIAPNSRYFIDIHTHSPVLDSSNSIGLYSIDSSDITPEQQRYLSTASYPLSIGLHPLSISDDRQKRTAQLHQLDTALMSAASICGIGECGFDRRAHVDATVQADVLRHHVQSAIDRNCGIIIHCVKMYDELISLRKTYSHRLQWVLHGYNKINILLAENLLASGFSLSFGAAVLSSAPLAQVAKSIPLNRVFLETDMRTDVTIQEVYEYVAELRSISVDTLKNQIAENYSYFTQSR